MNKKSEYVKQSTGVVNSIKLTVLVMDDEQDIRELFSLNLKKLGYETLLAANSGDALEIYTSSLESKSPVDVTILDLNIPGSLGGIEVAKKIRLMNVNAKIIVTSGSSNSPVMINYKDHGFDGALEKTFDRKKIKQLLEKLVGRSAVA